MVILNDDDQKTLSKAIPGPLAKIRHAELFLGHLPSLSIGSSRYDVTLPLNNQNTSHSTKYLLNP